MATAANIDSAPPQPLTCGIVMPISTLDGCPSEHWSEVKQIIQDAVEVIAHPTFTARLVSDADDVGVIQKRIVQGVYTSDIIVCDVSGRNPNVMFELGMRLAFDKPTVIIKDDKTDYTFDTSIIEHIPYPRDLRFSKITAFKKQLAEKVVATYKAATGDPEHSTFLKSFGTFKVAQVSQAPVSVDQAMIEALSELQQEVAKMRRSLAPKGLPYQLTAKAADPDAFKAMFEELAAIKLDKATAPTDIPPELLNLLLDKVDLRGFTSEREFERAANQVYRAWRLTRSNSH